MEPSKVYFTNLRTHNSVSLPEKLKRLIKKAGIGPLILTKNTLPSKFTSASREIWLTCAPITPKRWRTW